MAESGVVEAEVNYESVEEDSGVMAVNGLLGL